MGLVSQYWWFVDFGTHPSVFFVIDRFSVAYTFYSFFSGWLDGNHSLVPVEIASTCFYPAYASKTDSTNIWLWTIDGNTSLLLEILHWTISIYVSWSFWCCNLILFDHAFVQMLCRYHHTIVRYAIDQRRPAHHWCTASLYERWAHRLSNILVVIHTDFFIFGLLFCNLRTYHLFDFLWSLDLRRLWLFTESTRLNAHINYCILFRALCYNKQYPYRLHADCFSVRFTY